MELRDRTDSLVYEDERITAIFLVAPVAAVIVAVTSVRVLDTLPAVLTEKLAVSAGRLHDGWNKNMTN